MRLPKKHYKNNKEDRLDYQKEYYATNKEEKNNGKPNHQKSVIKIN